MVDDNIDHFTILQKGLERYGLSVKGYFSPLKALEEFHPGIYDVTIVNVMTHAMNGKDLSKNLVRVDNAIKLIFLTPTSEVYKENKHSDIKSFLEYPKTNHHQKTLWK